MFSSKLSMYVSGAILIILGALSLRYPLTMLQLLDATLVTILGIGLCVSGVNYLSGFCFFRRGVFAFLGVIDLVMGILLLTRPGINAFFIPFVIATWILLTGLSRIGTSLWLGGAGVRGWWLMLLSGVALVIFAGLMCASPLVSALSIMTVLAFGLIISGVFAIIEGVIIF